ncbi:MAG: manganese efflux pump MntP family protein [Bacteroidales bacterium]|nr:manganese efflux pump MntP family protein [Bacteroidales bacterium]
MNIAEILFIALGLSMDSLAVSITCGVILKRFRIRHIFRIALFMGIFQGIMPLIGWMAGVSFQKSIVDYDHWIAFGLLFLIGSRMIWEGLTSKNDQNNRFDPTKAVTLLALAIATSIDALAVGISFAMLNIQVAEPVIIIGITTFLLSFLGASFSSKFGQKFNFKMEIVGGIILIGMGTKIVLEHLHLLAVYL